MYDCAALSSEYLHDQFDAIAFNLRIYVVVDGIARVISETYDCQMDTPNVLPLLCPLIFLSSWKNIKDKKFNEVAS